MPHSVRVRSALARSLNRALLAIGIFAVLLGLLEVAILPLTGPGAPLLIMLPMIFWVYAGAALLAWSRRPSNRMGLLLLLAGVAFYLGSLSNTTIPALQAVGAVCATLVLPVLVHLLLAFPAGRLESRSTRIVVAGTYFVALVLEAPVYLWDPTGPYPPFAVADAPEALALSGLIQGICGAIMMTATAVILIRRMVRADATHRRVLIPLFTYGIFALLFIPFSALVVARLFGGDEYVRGYLQFAVVGFVPIAFVLGILRGGFARTGELEELGTWLGTAGSARQPIEAALARTLGDPSLKLYFRAEDRNAYVDAEGRAAAPSTRGWHEITLDGRTIGAIDFDAALLSDSELVRTASNVVAIAVDRDRLTAQLRASQRAVLRSRERLVMAADQERRRIARDLHDGLQVQLVMLALEAQQLANAGEVGNLPERATSLRLDIDAAARDLRNFVHDLVPAALIERGLSAAAEDLVDRMPVPTRLTIGITDARLAESVESTAFFVLAEALANVVKHAEADSVQVVLARSQDTLRLEVRDDGIGGASDVAGTGIRGLSDRVDAMGGVLHLSSPRGVGTSLTMELPCAL